MTCTQEQFLKDIAAHEMQILHEDGVYRHIRFKRPGTGCMHFDLITYPGYLVYSGDMGCYVFSRLDDMFEFFRANSKYQTGDGLKINLSYWSEKLQATDGNRGGSDGAMEYSADLFRQRVKEEFDNAAEYELGEGQRAKCWSEIEDRVLYYADDGDHEARRALSDFCSDDGFEFLDAWEWCLRDYSFSFVWCCYALAWGIKKYDEFKKDK